MAEVDPFNPWDGVPAPHAPEHLVPPRSWTCPRCHGCGLQGPCGATEPCTTCKGGGRLVERPREVKS